MFWPEPRWDDRESNDDLHGSQAPTVQRTEATGLFFQRRDAHPLPACPGRPRIEDEQPEICGANPCSQPSGVIEPLKLAGSV